MPHQALKVEDVLTTETIKHITAEYMLLAERA